MNIELSQDMINLLAYAISSRGSTVEELLDMLNYEFSNDSTYPTGDDPVSEYPEEVKSAFGSANDGVMYDDYLRYLSGSVQRSSLNKQMENTMRITETKLRRIIRKTLRESYSGSFLPSTARKGDTPKFPVEIDPSRSTVSAGAFGKAQMAITKLAVEDDLEVEEMLELKGALNTLNQCMEMGDDPSQCASRIKDETALMELGDILFDVDETSELNQYARNVMIAMGLEIN